MNIESAVNEIFLNKAQYYNEFLSAIEKNEFILLNFFEYKKNREKSSGDMDILISPKSYDNIKVSLESQGFFEYIQSNTDQIQWLKYVENIGIIQIHIHLDLSFYNMKIATFEDMYNGNILLDINREYILFVLQSFFKKNNFKNVQDKYNFFKNKIDKDIIHELLNSDYNKFKIIYNTATTAIENRLTVPKSTFYFLLLKIDFLSNIQYLSNKIIRKTQKLISFNSNDLEIIFMGVDGAGKSSTIENIESILGSEVMYREHYFGLKSSVINKCRAIISSNKHNNISTKKDEKSVDIKKNKQNISLLKKAYFLIIGFLYWIEYNVKYLFYIKLNHIVPSTIHLIDRSYYDALLYYDIKFVELLFFKFSFKPDLVVYLTGDTNKLYTRKKEISAEEINFNKSKYSVLMNKLKFFNYNVNIIDSTTHSEFEIKNIIMLQIFNKVQENNS